MLKVTNTCKVLLVKRFIHDIVFISESKNISREIIKSLKDTFEKYNLKITFSTMYKENKIIPFLDVEHGSRSFLTRDHF